MDYFKGYKIIKLNKEDVKKPGKFAGLEIEYEGFTNEIIQVLKDEDFDGLVYGLRKSGNYEAVYVFKAEDSILKFCKSFIMKKVATETIGIMEHEIYQEFKEQVNTDEEWSKVVWGHKIIEKKNKSFGGVNLFVSVVVYAIALAIGFAIDKIGICAGVGLVVAIVLGAIVSMLQEKGTKK